MIRIGDVTDSGGREIDARGKYVTLAFIDFNALALDVPEYVHDFPQGAGRYIQTARARL